ncbi:DMT family transporter [Alisedimentitalea sp. MJ-SS2]|uniref:DMT family transporter n=1 Tax=Aliisedimentitalea sp. MJ-SS2 TaxID=3049795 RepID=UPI002907E2A5|nr:DMT family transporter [Alisedimentitalea sp. MJ-SS2]MDU8926540.1 DMT family transporter [Alisedimentitalea sp. MJ-SS2]
MERKDHVDAAGAAAMILFAFLLGFNQVVIKVSTGGFQPVFLAGLRSVGAVVAIWAWMRWRGIAIRIPHEARVGALLLGLLFTAEFIFLYLSLDRTSVGRASIIFYSMPVFVAIGAHLMIAGERLNTVRALGLLLAMGGVVWVMSDQGAGQGDILGDVMALLAAMSWAGIALVVRVTPLERVAPEVQLFSQLIISAVLLMIAALFFGPFIRDLQPIHWAGYAFQTLAIASFGYLFWFFLMKRYPASGVASFSFLSPVFGVGLGWLFLNEAVGPEIIGGLMLVAVGITLINRR